MCGSGRRVTVSHILAKYKADSYKEYSEPVFGTRKVLRGGTWATHSRMLNNKYRNFFTPERSDVFAGFRTCAPHNWP